MVSGMSTGDAGGGPPGAAGGAASAEGIMKKLTNYWFIVGSIPLVMFLLVCLPTVFYVKSISDYKNAFYCRSKACDALAAATKAVRDAKPCDDFFTSVCKASPQFDIKNVHKKDAKLLANALTMLGDSPPPGAAATGLYGKCGVGSELITPDSYAWEMTSAVFGGKTFKELFDGADADPAQISESIKTIFTAAQQHGIDCLFHLEWMRGATVRAFSESDPKPTIGEELPNKMKTADIAVSVPDMGIMEPTHYIVDMIGKKHEEVLTLAWDQLKNQADDLDEDKVAAFVVVAKSASQKMYSLIEYSKDLDYTVAPRMVLHAGEFAVPVDVPDTFEIQAMFPFAEAVLSVFPAFSQHQRFLVRSPNYVDLLSRAVNLVPAGDPTKAYVTIPEFYVFVILDTLLRAAGPFTIPKTTNEEVWILWCSRYVDWLLPSALAHTSEKYLMTTYWPFGLKNPKDPKNPFSPFTLGIKYMSSLLEAFIHSYALSAASSEKSRANLYTKMLQLDYFAFYPNASDKANDSRIAELVSKAPIGDDFSIKPFWDNRKLIFDRYWADATADLKDRYIERFPMMFSDDVGSYDYGTNLMFVPFGMFRPSFYRDSTAYMGNYATFGYYGSKNILKMLNNAGSYSKAGYNFPIMWPGTYAVGKMNWHYRCFNPNKINETKARLLSEGNNPISPGYRYFRKYALARASPRPEYRLDLDAKADMEQIYLTAVMRTFCRYKTMKEDINTMFQHDMYFQNGYCAEGGKMKMEPGKMCYIWHSTRRSY